MLGCYLSARRDGQPNFGHPSVPPETLAWFPEGLPETKLGMGESREVKKILSLLH